jgi:PAS domain S-box-containing protein
MLGYAREDLVRMTWAELTYPDDLAPDLAQFERLLRGEIESYTLEKRFVRKDGSLVFTQLAVGCVRLADRSVDYVLALLEDITARKHAEENIEKMNAELQQRAVMLEAANKELEAFSYSVSHDLRAPLRSIDGFSRALLKDYSDKLDSEGKSYLEIVRQASQRMGRLIDDMLELARVTRTELKRTEVDLSALATTVSAEMRADQPNRAVTLAIEPGLTAVADSNLVRAVLENLLGNAWKFTGKQPAAHIEFGRVATESGSAFFVRDNGAGFDPQFRHKLFNAFQRLHGASEFPGTGIGLATVQRIIHRHGGRVWAESARGQGATFYFTLSK